MRDDFDSEVDVEVPDPSGSEARWTLFDPARMDQALEPIVGRRVHL